MESIDTELAAQIRHDIIIGAYDEKERLSEARLCEAHSVSRTPVRLALRMLEHEGLIRRSEGRGYFVNAPKVHDVLQAVAVRGHLESLAARLMAQSVGRDNMLPALAAAIDEIDRLVTAGNMDDASLRKMQKQNATFHKTILDGCGNDFFEAIQSGDGVRAEGVMREHSNTMVEYIKVFEKRNEDLTIKDLIGYSGLSVTRLEHDSAAQ